MLPDKKILRDIGPGFFTKRAGSFSSLSNELKIPVPNIQQSELICKVPEQGLLSEMNPFFSYYSLEESQQLLWQLFKLAFSRKPNHQSRKEWDNLISYYENLDDLLKGLYKNIIKHPV